MPERSWLASAARPGVLPLLWQTNPRVCSLPQRNLDNYVPLATRQDRIAAAKEGGAKEAVLRRAVAPTTGRVTKPKRGAQKRYALAPSAVAAAAGCPVQPCHHAAVSPRLRSVESDTWSSDVDASELSFGATTDDSAGSPRTALRTESSRAAAVASKLKLSYITSQTQLKVGSCPAQANVLCSSITED